MYVAISAGAVLLLLVFIPDIFADSNGEEKKPSRRGKGEQTAERKAEAAPEEPNNENPAD